MPIIYSVAINSIEKRGFQNPWSIAFIIAMIIWLIYPILERVTMYKIISFYKENEVITAINKRNLVIIIFIPFLGPIIFWYKMGSIIKKQIYHFYKDFKMTIWSTSFIQAFSSLTKMKQ
ncbi:hypothetical protein [Spiroplasma floricola]|uniref:Uncharacterized protein n=1 Tax=Spiroplasma floricola 23-6 TaxID=1336749 RepID=A0A2K8SDZ7_9MOLU|nr:hypothetical protein [Spiroplasma floricola]AUB31686.1 hypothetical protein SFLOR_v1c06360 [Spiroplasma floricola 23-6]